MRGADMSVLAPPQNSSQSGKADAVARSCSGVAECRLTLRAIDHPGLPTGFTAIMGSSFVFEYGRRYTGYSASRQPALEQSIAEKGKQKGSRRSSAKHGAYGARCCMTVASQVEERFRAFPPVHAAKSEGRLWVENTHCGNNASRAHSRHSARPSPILAGLRCSHRASLCRPCGCRWRIPANCFKNSLLVQSSRRADCPAHPLISSRGYRFSCDDCLALFLRHRA